MHLNGASISDPKFLARLQHFAQHTVGRNIELNGHVSGDRTQEEQKALYNGNATDSEHLRSRGADIHVDGMSDEEVAQYAVESGLFRGVELSVGLSQQNRGAHVHVDYGNQQRFWTEFSDGSTMTGVPMIGHLIQP